MTDLELLQLHLEEAKITSDWEDPLEIARRRIVAALKIVELLPDLIREASAGRELRAAIQDSMKADLKNGFTVPIKFLKMCGDYDREVDGHGG